MRQYLSTLWGVVGTLASLILAVVFIQVATSTPAPPTSGLYGCEMMLMVAAYQGFSLVTG